MRVFSFLIFIFLSVVVIPPCTSAYAQVGKTPEETWNNVVQQVNIFPAKKAFHAVYDYVEWDLLYGEIKAENNKFLVKERIASSEALKSYAKDAGVSVVDGAKVLAVMSEKPFLMELFTRAMDVSGQEDMGNLANVAGQYAEVSKKGKNTGLPFNSIVADLEHPTDYLKFTILSKEVLAKDREVRLRVLATDLRTDNSQVMYIPLVKTDGKWYLRSYLPEGLWKNFNTRIDSTDMQRVIKLARLLQKFE